MRCFSPIRSSCEPPPAPRYATTELLGGAVLVLLAVVLLLVHWTMYSKAWDFASYGRARLHDEAAPGDVELQRP